MDRPVLIQQLKGGNEKDYFVIATCILQFILMKK